MLPELLDYSDLFNSKVATYFSLKHSAMVTNLHQLTLFGWVGSLFGLRYL